MKIKMTKKNGIVIAALVVTMAIGGVAAYFTSTDAAANTFTVGKVEIKLQEPEYDKVPAERQNITPNKTLTKDPQIENTGINDAFVFVRFSVPKANVRIANAAGAAQSAAVRELFDYTINPSWTQVNKTEGADKNTYVYAYATASACTPLAAKAKTPALFKNSNITFVNVLEGQSLEGKTLEIPVEAYAIQTTDLGASKTTVPAAVWSILSGQVESH